MTSQTHPGSVTKRIREHPVAGKPLGRHVNHDPRSRNFAAPARAAAAVSQRWYRQTAILNQGDLGSCTGNAADGVLGTDPFFPTVQQAKPDWDFGEAGALSIYSLATTLDPFKGQYPPTDTGSDGLSVAKACVQLGLISGYRHCLSLDAVVTALQLGPVITGVNWYDSFDSPDGTGLIGISSNAQVRGGHEIEIFGLDMDNHQLWMDQSWGPDWGVAGTFCWSFDTYDRLLHEQGDATVFVPASQPAPTPTPPAPADADHVFAATATKATRTSRPFRTWKTAKGL